MVNIDIPNGEVARLVDEAIETGYNELLLADLITDPIIETTLALAILPFVPFSIVKRTQKGQVVYRKLQAFAWKWEQVRLRGGTIQTNLTFEVARIANAIKVGLTAAIHETTKSAGGTPDEIPPVPPSTAI
jgi:hypothetical protein